MFSYTPVTKENFSEITRLFDRAQDDWVETPDQTWLNHILMDDGCEALLIVDDAGTPIGYLQLEKEPAPKNVYSLALFLSKSFRGKGLGTNILKDFVKIRPKTEKFVAHIAENNFLSVLAFVKAGFVPTDRVDADGHREYLLEQPV
tara:strand:- start:9052 stop:9489 length:438 start_codon:yes stop_codon:yes gene_type:complete